MIKNHKKNIEKFDDRSYPTAGEFWRKDFINLIPHSKRRSEIIKYVEMVDWERIGHLLSSDVKAIMKKIGVPGSGDSLNLNISIVEAIILANIKDQSQYLILHYLSNISRNDTKSLKNEKIKQLELRVELEISRIKSVWGMILDFGSLKWIKDSDINQNIIDTLKKKFSKSYGKKYKIDNVEYYHKIYTKNDEYIEKDGESNYRKAARNLIKNSDSLFEKIYKSFNKFKNKNNIHTLKEFESFLSTIDGR